MPRGYPGVFKARTPQESDAIIGLDEEAAECLAAESRHQGPPSWAEHASGSRTRLLSALGRRTLSKACRHVQQASKRDDGHRAVDGTASLNFRAWAAVDLEAYLTVRLASCDPLAGTGDAPCISV